MKAFEKIVIAVGVMLVVGAIVVLRIAVPGSGPVSVEGDTSPVEKAGPGRRPGPAVTARRGAGTVRKPSSARSAGSRIVSAVKSRGPVALARVNGAAIMEHQVFGRLGVDGMLSSGAEMESLQGRLDRAIDEELLHQYAVETGLGRSAEYAEARNRRELQLKRDETRALARFYESNNDELAALRESTRATDGEVARYLLENEGARWRMDEERVRRMLSERKYNEAYAKWFAGVLEGVPVSVNGQVILAETVIAALDARPMWGGRRGGGRGNREAAGALAEQLRSAAGLPAGGSGETTLDVEVVVGSSSFQAGQLLSGSGGGRRGGRRGGMPRGMSLADTVKSSVVAEMARQEGVDTSVAYRDRLTGPVGLGRSSAEVVARDILSTMVWNEVGLTSRDDVDVSDGEVDEYMEANSERYARFLEGRRGEEWARRMAQRAVGEEKLEQQRAGFLQELRAVATIEILDNRFAGS